jgi:hypothetical protein
MTRKSRREIETDVDELAAETATDTRGPWTVVIRDPKTGAWYTHRDGERVRVDRDTTDGMVVECARDVAVGKKVETDT